MILELSPRSWVVLVAAGSLLLLLLPWGYVILRRRRRRWLLEHGREAKGRIVSLTPSGLTFGSGSANVKGVRLELEVIDDHVESYRVETHAQLHVLDLAHVTPGTIVRLRVHPEDPNRVAIEDQQR